MLHFSESELHQFKPPPSTVRKNALGYGSASFHPDLSRRGHSLESSSSVLSTSPQKDEQHARGVFAPPPPLLLVAADQSQEEYRSRRGPRVRFADEFRRAVDVASFTPEISPVDHSLVISSYLPKPQPVEVHAQISRSERNRRQQQRRVSPTRRSLSSEATTGVSSQSSSRTSSPFERNPGRRESPPAPYCRTDLETVKLPMWGFRSGSTESNNAPSAAERGIDVQLSAVSSSSHHHHHDLQSAKILPRSKQTPRILADEPFSLHTERRSLFRLVAGQTSLHGSTTEASNSVQPRPRVASRSPIRISPNKYATELRMCLSKSPTRVPFSGATVTSSATSATTLTSRKPSAASSVRETTRSSSAVSSSGTTPRSSLSSLPLRSARLLPTTVVATLKPPKSLPLQPSNRMTVPSVDKPSDDDEPTLHHPTIMHGRPQQPVVKAPTMVDVMEMYRQKLDALKHSHDRNMAKIQQQKERVSSASNAARTKSTV